MIRLHLPAFGSVVVITIVVMYFAMTAWYGQQMNTMNTQMEVLKLLTGDSKPIFDAQQQKIRELEGALAKRLDERRIFRHMME